MEKTQADIDAEWKYQTYKSSDPYPDILPALLNSADIHSYVNATGMIEPFAEEELKPASYEAKIGGVCKYWDEDGKEKELTIDAQNKTFTLKPNSIAFVEVEPKFRLPDYIALRFNLKITHVYRGLLLGTGPLIDPGYVGKIYIPLHNLTANSYVFEYGEGLIWIEFTKISNLAKWKGKRGKQIASTGAYKSFPPSKKDKNLNYFLHKANKGGSIRSSIPVAVQDAKEMAEKAKKSAAWMFRFNVFAILAVVGSISVLLYNSWALQRDYVVHASKETSELRSQIIEQRILYEKMKVDFSGIQNQRSELNKKLDSISNELNAVRKLAEGK